MRAEVYRHRRDASLFMIVPKGAVLPDPVYASDGTPIRAEEWRITKELEIDPQKLYVGLDVQAAMDDLKRQGWHLGTSKSSGSR